MKDDEVLHGQSDNSLLIDVVKSIAVLTSKFDSFEKLRSEDNVELKASIEKVDRKVDGLDIKLEKMKETNDKKINELKDTYDAKINELQKAPLKDKADKFEAISKLVVETIIAACLIVILVKIGLK